MCPSPQPHLKGTSKPSVWSMPCSPRSR
jgi:hypothetical protein